MPPSSEIRTVSFRHPFRLDEVGETWPAGVYEIETQRESIASDVFEGGYMISTVIHRHDRGRGVREAVRVHADVLTSALEADARRSAADVDVPRAFERTEREPGPVAGGPGRRWLPAVTPVWVVPLAVALLVAVGALFGPFVVPAATMPAVVAEP